MNKATWLLPFALSACASTADFDQQKADLVIFKHHVKKEIHELRREQNANNEAVPQLQALLAEQQSLLDGLQAGLTPIKQQIEILQERDPVPSKERFREIEQAVAAIRNDLEARAAYLQQLIIKTEANVQNLGPVPALTDEAYQLRSQAWEPPALDPETRVGAKNSTAIERFERGDRHHHGLGTIQDYKKAASWYYLAAELGHAGARFRLGHLYEKGQGVKQSLMHAHMWFNLAAAKGYSHAFAERARIEGLLRREAVEKSQINAREWENSLSY